MLTETIYSSTTTYWVLNKPIELFSDETSYGWQTFAEVDSVYHDLGDKLVNLHTAVEVFQHLNNVILTNHEFELVIMENALKLMELENKINEN